MNFIEFSLWIEDDKLILRSDRVAGETTSFYLPDCTQEQIESFITKRVKEYAAVMASQRPWRNEGER